MGGLIFLEWLSESGKEGLLLGGNFMIVLGSSESRRISASLFFGLRKTFFEKYEHASFSGFHISSFFCYYTSLTLGWQSRCFRAKEEEGGIWSRIAMKNPGKDWG